VRGRCKLVVGPGVRVIRSTLSREMDPYMWHLFAPYSHDKVEPRYGPSPPPNLRKRDRTVSARCGSRRGRGHRPGRLDGAAVWCAGGGPWAKLPPPFRAPHGGAGLGRAVSHPEPWAKILVVVSGPPRVWRRPGRSEGESPASNPACPDRPHSARRSSFSRRCYGLRVAVLTVHVAGQPDEARPSPAPVVTTSRPNSRGRPGGRAPRC